MKFSKESCFVFFMCFFQDIVEVNIDTSQLTDSSSNPWIQVNVTGEGEELKPQDNGLFMSFPLEAHASLELFG